MSGASILNRVRTAVGRFVRADEGNIAVIFAIAAVPIISFVGAAIDYTRMNKSRTAMQAAMDSTALMLSKDFSEGLISQSEINAKAQTYFNALFHNADANSVTITANYTASTTMGSTIVMTGSGNITTDFLKVAGFPKLDFGTGATSAWGNVRMRVAMVLDNTGSMKDDGKMPAMQSAAKALVDQLSPLAKTAGDIYISIVPFAKDVNMGASFVNSTWIDWTDWDANNGYSTCTAWNWRGNCTASYWTPNDHSKWTGCFTDRTQDYDISNTTPGATAATKFPAEQYSYCKVGVTSYLQPIMPLSYDWTALKTKIDDMKPTGNTNQGIGLAWGWMTLMGGDPFNAPAKDTNYTYKDAIVLLSDGLNTQNRWYSNAAQIDARQRLMCDNIKAVIDPKTNKPQYTVYTVQVNTGGDATSAVLQYCATDPDKFFLVTSADQTATVFKTIGTSLTKLHVAK